MAVNTPAFARQRLALNTVKIPEQGVRRQAGTQGRGDIVLGPAHHLHQRFPKRLLLQVGVGHIGAGDDQRVQTLFLQVFKFTVVTIDIFEGFRTPR